MLGVWYTGKTQDPEMSTGLSPLSPSADLSRLKAYYQLLSSALVSSAEMVPIDPS